MLAIIATQDEIARSDLDLDAVMQLVVARAMAITGAAAAVVELLEGEEMVYHVACGSAEAHVGLRLRADSSLSGLCVREGRVLHCRNAGGDDRVDYDACLRVGAISMVCLPLSHHTEVVGVLKVYDPAPYRFSDTDVQMLELLSGVIAAHMAHARQLEEHRYGSHHDPLTQLANRRALDERLQTESSRANRHGSRFSVCLIDLDRFKGINDSGGHAAGDEVLRKVAVHLRGVRREDDAFRIGGDEFALLFVEAPAEGVRAALDRLIAAIRADAACRGVGLSYGIAVHRPGEEPEALLARADAELYEAKGRPARISRP